MFTAGWVHLLPRPNRLSTAEGAREAQRDHSPLLLVEFASTSLAKDDKDAQDEEDPSDSEAADPQGVVIVGEWIRFLWSFCTGHGEETHTQSQDVAGRCHCPRESARVKKCPLPCSLSLLKRI